MVSPNFSDDKFNTEELILKIYLSGKLNIYNSSELFIFIKIMEEGGLNKVLLNLRDLEEIDSTGIGILIKIINFLKINNKKIVMTDVPSKILKVLKIVKVEKLVKIFNTDDDSLAFLQAE